MPSDADLMIRLLVAALLAGAIGIERELTDQPAGFRTHILVGVGSALFAILSAVGFRTAGDPGAIGHVDPTRIAAQIVTGIGFIGAGVIWKSGSNIRGLTTAATLWTTAAIGTGAGLGAYALAGATTVVAILALVGLRPLRRLVRMRTPGRREFLVEGGSDLEIGLLISETAREHASVDQVRVSGENGTKTVRLMVRVPADVPPGRIADHLADVPNVTSVDWSAA